MNSTRRLNQHFTININGENYIYVYIRKNACSAWKKVFISESSHYPVGGDNLRPIEFMNKYHRVSSLEEVTSIKRKIVILRDPVIRVYSAFINQIVMRMDRQYSLHSSIEHVTGKPIGRLNFSEFVNLYLTKVDLVELDGHFQPQHRALLDIEYSDVWSLSDLHQKSSELFGAPFADRYFAKKVNSTERLIKSDERAWDLKIREIAKKYTHENIVPKIEALVRPETAEKLILYYKKDYQLLEKNGLSNILVSNDMFGRA
jgi:hypothetical protein